MFPRFRSRRSVPTSAVPGPRLPAAGLHPFPVEGTAPTTATAIWATHGSDDKVRTRSGRVVLQVANPESPQSLTLRAGFASKGVFDGPDTELGTSATCPVPDALAADSSYLAKLISPQGYTKFLKTVRTYGGSITPLNTDSFDTDPPDSYIVAVDRCCAAHSSTFGASVPPVFALMMPTTAAGVAAVKEAWVELVTSWAADWTVRRVRTRSQVGPRTLAATGWAAPTPSLIFRWKQSLYEPLVLKLRWYRAKAKGHNRYSDSARQAFKR